MGKSGPRTAFSRGFSIEPKVRAHRALEKPLLLVNIGISLQVLSQEMGLVQYPWIGQAPHNAPAAPKMKNHALHYFHFRLN
jgi:hypothetical protein